MKRYKWKEEEFHEDSKMVEDPEGEWVKYEDVEKEIESAYLSGSSDAVDMHYGID